MYRKVFATTEVVCGVLLSIIPGKYDHFIFVHSYLSKAMTHNKSTMFKFTYSLQCKNFRTLEGTCQYHSIPDDVSIDIQPLCIG